MNPISPTSPASSGISLAGTASQSALGRDDFLQLLVTQLRNQDPTSPQNSSEFAAQLAQFTSVEQLTNISQSMTGQAQQLAALAQAVGLVGQGQAALGGQLANRIDLQSASTLIGQTVQVQSPAVAWDGTAPVDIGVYLAGDAREVEVTIRNAAGDVVRVLRTGARDAGTTPVTWDGAGADGQPLPPGSFTASVRALDDTGAAVAAAPSLSGRVDRLTVEADGVFLWVGGQRVPFSALLTVEGGAPPSPSPAPPPAPTPPPSAPPLPL